MNKVEKRLKDDGILTDSQGRKVDFKNTIIIMTSNVGASTLSAPRSLGFSDVKEDNDKKASDARVMGALKATFRPEFINRIDDIIIFNSLDSEGIEKIASLMLTDVAKRILELGVSIEFDKSVIEFVSREGFDPEYGARPLRRTIVRKIEDSFSTEMLEGKFKAGDKIKAVFKDDNIVYSAI